MKRVSWHIPEAAGVKVWPTQCVFDMGWTEVSGRIMQPLDKPIWPSGDCHCLAWQCALLWTGVLFTNTLHTPATALCPGLPRWAGTRKVEKTNLDFTEARDSEWQWHQLGCMQVCISLQTDNHASTPPLRVLQAGCRSCRPTNSVKALVYYSCTMYYYNDVKQAKSFLWKHTRHISLATFQHSKQY